MKILWLTPGQLSAALLFGIMIAICNISIPHMVDEVKPQVITPVPTPPPVVIIQEPNTLLSSDNSTNEVSKLLLEYNEILLSPFFLIFTAMILITTMIASSSRLVSPIIIIGIGIAWWMGWIGWVGFVTMVGVCFMSMFIPSLFRMGSDNI